jgi:hypothetical protein
MVGVVSACLVMLGQPAVAEADSPPCGPGAVAPARVQHVVWIVFENRTYDSIIGSPNAPYINSLAQQCGLATNYYAVARPSLPNYIAMTSGSTQGITDGAGPASHPLSVPSIFLQLGSDWRALQESMPSNCLKSDASPYVVRHNPAAYYTNIDCATLDVPLTSPPDLSAAFTFVTPNVCNDMHDCSTLTGDTWLSTFMPSVLSSPEYLTGGTVVFVTFDEGGSSSQHIATLVVSPYTPPGTEASDFFDHYALLRTTEELLGLEPLDTAALAHTMANDFGLPSPSYVRPKGATPVRSSLVLAFRPCAAPNREHGSPLIAPSCHPPVPASTQLTVGSPTNSSTAKAVGSVALKTITGDVSTPENEADVQLTFSAVDIRKRSDFSDYTGQVLVDHSLRITDKSNGAAATESATVEDARLPVPADCVATADQTIGATCSVTTTLNAVVPALVIERKRAIWELGPTEVYDAGADADVTTTADNTLFMNEGIFVP